MAAPHVTGLAALYLAHHPIFKGPLRERNTQRVAALFNMIKSSTSPYQFGVERTGAGVPTLHGLIQAIMAAEQQPVAATAPSFAQGAAAAVVPPPMAGIPPSPYALGSQLGAVLGGIIGNILGNTAAGAQFSQPLGGLAPFQPGVPTTAPQSAAPGITPSFPTPPQGMQPQANPMYGILGNQQSGRWWYPWI